MDNEVKRIKIEKYLDRHIKEAKYGLDQFSKAFKENPYHALTNSNLAFILTANLEVFTDVQDSLTYNMSIEELEEKLKEKVILGSSQSLNEFSCTQKSIMDHCFYNAWAKLYNWTRFEGIFN